MQRLGWSDLTEIQSMAKKHHPVTQFRHEIAALISEVETCMCSVQPNRDREFKFQHKAFQERCDQANSLTSRLKNKTRSEWSMRSGDAHRIQESLKLSLAYFRGRPAG
jgi:hypothetical protein